MKLLFEPAAPETPTDALPFVAGDREGKEVYCYTPELTFAVNVALAARRPLLVTGPSGCGKSSLARDIAKVLRWRYLEQVISSRTQAQDLLWRFDSVRRLSDGAAGALKKQNDQKYIEPGVLWWAFQPATAERRGQSTEPVAKKDRPVPPYMKDGVTNPDQPAVVLIDEIDKADPDVPNALLVPIGSYTFRVDGVETPVEADPEHPPLIVITSNGERELPTAFRRRCVEFAIGAPDKQHLRRIATARFGATPAPRGLYEAILDRITNPEDPNDRPATGGHHINTAQFLDAIHACLSLSVDASAHPDEAVKILDTVWPTARGAS